MQSKEAVSRHRLLLLGLAGIGMGPEDGGMIRKLTMLPMALLMLSMGLSESPFAAPTGDDFRRENKNRELKDPLEGKAPPVLTGTSGWLNTNGQPLKLADLKGKVVVLDFWGTW